MWKKEKLIFQMLPKHKYGSQKLGRCETYYNLSYTSSVNCALKNGKVEAINKASSQ